MGGSEKQLIAISQATTQPQSSEGKKNSGRRRRGFFRNLWQHVRYHFRKSENVAPCDWKTLMTRFDIMLAEDVIDDVKPETSELISKCSDRSLKKLLRLCSRILKDTASSYTRKMNATQFIVAVALSNDYNAYKVARSRAISAVYKLGTINSERDGHKAFGDHANKAQILKCSMYAKNVIEKLSKPESYGEDSQKGLPFGVEYLISKCVEFKKQYHLVGVAALHSSTSINEAISAGSQGIIAVLSGQQGANTKYFQARMKEIEYRVTLVEDEMRELGIGRGRKPSLENQDDKSVDDPYGKVIELVGRLSQLIKDAECVMSDAGDAQDPCLKEELGNLINRIDTLKDECKGKYIDEPAQNQQKSLAQGFNAIKGNAEVDDEDFHSTREYLDVFYVTNLSTGDGMSSHTYKSAKTEYTAKEAFTDSGTVLDEVEIEEVIDNDSAQCSSRFSDTTTRKKDANETGGELRIVDANEVIDLNVPALPNALNAADIARSDTKDEIKPQEPMDKVDPNAVMREMYELELLKKVESTDCIVSGALGMIDTIKGLLARGVSFTSLNSIGVTSSDKGKQLTLSEQSTSKETLNAQETVETTMDSECMGNESGNIIRSSSWLLDSGRSLNGEASGVDSKQNAGNAFSNMYDIRNVVMYGECDIYRDDNMRVGFRQQILSEGTGKVVECQLKLMNTSTKTIESMRFDFSNFDQFPLHLVIEKMSEEEVNIQPNEFRSIQFKLYPLGSFIGLPRIKVYNTIADVGEQSEYLLYLPLPITSFLIAETQANMEDVEAMQKQFKSHYLVRNTVEYSKLASLATLSERFLGLKLPKDPNTIYIMASLHQSQYENSANKCLGQHKVLVKLEVADEPKAFNLSVYSKSERLAGAMLRLYKYLFHNRGDVYHVVQ